MSTPEVRHLTPQNVPPVETNYRRIATCKRSSKRSTPAASWPAPANSFINELVTEAARLSIVRDGQPAVIEYEPAPTARLRD